MIRETTLSDAGSGAWFRLPRASSVLVAVFLAPYAHLPAHVSVARPAVVRASVAPQLAFAGPVACVSVLLEAQQVSFHAQVLVWALEVSSLVYSVLFAGGRVSLVLVLAIVPE